MDMKAYALLLALGATAQAQSMNKGLGVGDMDGTPIPWTLPDNSWVQELRAPFDMSKVADDDITRFSSVFNFNDTRDDYRALFTLGYLQAAKYIDAGKTKTRISYGGSMYIFPSGTYPGDGPPPLAGEPNCSFRKRAGSGNWDGDIQCRMDVPDTYSDKFTGVVRRDASISDKWVAFVRDDKTGHETRIGAQMQPNSTRGIVSRGYATMIRQYYIGQISECYYDELVDIKFGNPTGIKADGAIVVGRYSQDKKPSLCRSPANATYTDDGVEFQWKK